MGTEDHLREHETAGRRVSVRGVETFVREEGDGPPVLLLHGVPVSSFLYRKMLPALADRGLRGIAYDLPGLGLADRPTDFDYSWSGLGAYAVGLVDALDLDRFHLVVHDIGGPVGFELAHVMPERILSITVLNTLIEVSRFRKPWVMRPFEVARVGEAYLATMIPSLFVPLMYTIGVSDRRLAPPDEVAGHLRLLKRRDGGKAFLRIMRSFEPTQEKEARYVPTVRGTAYPVQAIWGARDPALPLSTYGAVARRLVGDDRFFETPGKHFLQETEAPYLAERVAVLAASG